MTLATLLLLTLTAAQATPPTDAPRDTTTVTTPPLVDSPEACSASAEADYTDGFDALVRGEDESALEAFERVLAACPQHPYATELVRLTRARLTPGGQLALAAVSEMGPERRSVAGLATMTVMQTLHGATQGILLCAIAECSGQGYAAVSLLGAGAGAAGTLLLARDGVTSGQAAVINSGTVWGFWFGVASMLALDLEGDDALAATMLGGAGFTGVGILLATTVRPTAAQVSMANSGGLWAGVVTALLVATADGGETKTLFAIELGTTALGIVTLATLSNSLTVSRGRMLIIDAGGILGGLLGAAATFLVAGDDAGDAILVGSAAGVVTGLAVTAYITRDFDARNAPQAVLTPAIVGRDGAGVALSGRF
ncbi:hypothetical protein [Pyxidicoccus trucidator]|uniref:hypothetical protein n=1 Tax=Pyxidicoccus trucidator TaxID=2709662 RepID=UPI0013DCFDB1|nr:hypothetical protein [Pyxidicoccus trucidator]